MSYILDALKKSERQRPPGPVPDLFTVHGPQPPSPRWPARAIVIAALLLAVPAIALWAWIAGGRRDESAGRPLVAASPQRGAEVPAAPVTPQTVAAPTSPATARVAAVDAATAPARKPVAMRPQSPAPPARISRGAFASTVVPAAIPTAPPVPAAPAPVAVPEAPVTSAPSALPLPPQPGGAVPAVPAQIREVPPGGIPAAPPVASPGLVPVAPAPEETPPADGRVLELTELPAPIRSALPKLLVSGHVWSEEPSLRLLSVDDRLLHQGAEAAPGVSLQEITQEGAVFVFRGWHFRVAGGRQ